MCRVSFLTFLNWGKKVNFSRKTSNSRSYFSEIEIWKESRKLTAVSHVPVSCVRALLCRQKKFSAIWGQQCSADKKAGETKNKIKFEFTSGII